MKPCPFCGAVGAQLHTDAVLRDGCLPGEAEAWAASVVCRCCASQGPWKKADTAEDAGNWARREWNKRPIYGERRDAILELLTGREMTTGEIAAELGMTERGALEALTRQANAGRVWVPRKRSKAHMWALVEAAP